MDKHIPGPWGVQRTYTALEIRTAESKPVATLPGYKAPYKTTARLIAAAPDLLAALKAIEFQVRQGKVFERDACITQARAAIAKAIGGAI